MSDLKETQQNLEELFGRNQLMPVLRDQFSPLTEDPFELDVLVQIYLHKQASPETMVGIFSPKWGSPQDVADLLVECVQKDLLDFDMESGKFVLIYSITSDVEEMLSRYQFPLPMVVKPLEVNHNNMGSGYFDKKGSIILNGSSVFDMEDECLDHINRSNGIPLTINMEVTASEEGNMIVPKRKPDEHFEEYSKRKKQAETFYKTSLDVMQGLMALTDTIYMTHKYDRRGRTYAVGYHVNPQGTDYNKAVLELRNRKTVTR